MISPPSTRDTDLRETVHSLNDEVAKRERAKAARENLPLLWAGSVKWLLDRIEHVYLLEFLMLNAMRVERRSADFFVPGFDTFPIERMTIIVGAEEVALTPVVHHPERATVRMSTRKHDGSDDLFCELTSINPKWSVHRKESGLRRVIGPYLPVKIDTLDEPLFRSLLNQCLCGPQPVLSVGSEELRSGLGHLLDFVTSDDVRRSLSLGVKTSVGEVGRKLSLAAPAVTASVLKALPRRSPSLTQSDEVPRIGYSGSAHTATTDRASR